MLFSGHRRDKTSSAPFAAHRKLFGSESVAKNSVQESRTSAIHICHCPLLSSAPKLLGYDNQVIIKIQHMCALG